MRRWMMACLVLVASAALPTLVAAADPPTVLVMFDGSGSMWGKPDGEAKTKLVLARDAVKLGLAKVPPQTRIGLMTFGHRRGGDCNDIEMLVPPDANSTERINQALEKHNPRGRGPLTNALREASKSLGPASAPASVVLIHDDPDNCQMDPCSALADLRRAHPQVVVHVVALAMPREDAQRMSCLAKPTGGTVTEVQTAQQANAALDAILQTASLAGRRPPPIAGGKAEPKQTKAGAPAAAAVPQRPGLQLSASLAQGGEPIETALRWRVLPTGQSKSQPIYEADAAAPFVELAPGRYDIEAQHGFVVARASIEIAAGKAHALAMPLGAGAMRLASGRPVVPVMRDAVISFARLDSAPGDAVAMLRGVVSEVALTPGTYAVSVTVGSVRVERQAIIAAGRITNLEPQLDFGEVEFGAVAGAGGPPIEGAVYTVYEDDPDASQGRREIARSAAIRPLLALPQGTYYVVVRLGTAEARDRVTVKAGEREQKVLTLPLVRLSVTLRLPGSLQAADQPSLRLERQDDTKDVMLFNRATATADVVAGKYRLEARVGQGNIRIDRELDLKVGAREQLLLEPAAGGLNLRVLEQNSGTPVADVNWDVRDRTGKSVWTASQSDVRLLLLQGRYTIRAAVRGKQITRDIDVRAGEARQLDLMVQ